MGEPILDMRRLSAKIAPRNEAVTLELSQMLCQDFLRQVRDIAK